MNTDNNKPLHETWIIEFYNKTISFEISQSYRMAKKCQNHRGFEIRWSTNLFPWSICRYQSSYRTTNHEKCQPKDCVWEGICTNGAFNRKWWYQQVEWQLWWWVDHAWKEETYTAQEIFLTFLLTRMRICKRLWHYISTKICYCIFINSAILIKLWLFVILSFIISPSSKVHFAIFNSAFNSSANIFFLQCI